jgi:hypothetical protein
MRLSKRNLGEELQRALFVDTVEGVSQGVVVESAGVDAGSEKQFGVLLRNEILDPVQGASTGKRVANHPDDQGSDVDVGVAGNVFIDEVD